RSCAARVPPAPAVANPGDHGSGRRLFTDRGLNVARKTRAKPTAAKLRARAASKTRKTPTRLKAKIKTKAVKPRAVKRAAARPAKRRASRPVKGKWVYAFGDGKAEGRADMRDLLGGKGANLAEMSNLGLPVPPGFTITTEVCTYFYANDRRYPPTLRAQVDAALKRVEKIVGAKFGDRTDPLLVSVRSGARASMPGMMDTVLNLGL